MRTTIIISGQPNGNFTLKNLIQTHDSMLKELGFGNFALTFSSRKTAKEAIRYAYKYLKLEDCRVTKTSNNTSINYDASRAYIQI